MIEPFIYSHLNIQREPKLQGCYDQLIETISRIEFPSDNRLPQVRNLVQTCNWNNIDKDLTIDNSLADRITTLAKNSIAKPVALSTTSLDANGKNPANVSKMGFNPVEFEPSIGDELARLELTSEESDIEKNPVAQQQYQYAINSKFIVVKARAGDTVTKLAERHGVRAIEVAKFNGLLPNSILSAGREVKIPQTGTGETWQAISNRTGVSVADLMAANPGMTTPRGKVFVPVKGNTVNNVVYSRPPVKRPVDDDAKLIGARPSQAKNGKISVIMSYFNEVLHDPYSMRIVRWSPVTRITVVGGSFWRIAVKYRAKNRMGAYVLSERVFYIRHNKIVSSFELD